MKDILRQQCPPLDTLAAFHEGRLAPAASRSLQQHTEVCPACRTDLALLREFADAQSEPAEAADVQRIAARLKQVRAPKKSWWSAWSVPKWSAAMAALVLLVVVGVRWQSQSRKETDLSGFQGSQTLRSSTVLEVTPRGDFFVVPTNFVWNPISEAVSYEVVVSEVDGTELWRSRTSDPRLPVPPSVTAALLPLKTVVVQVTALDGSGARLAQSEATRIRYVKR